MPRTREELLDLLKAKAELYREMASQYQKEADAEQKDMMGLYWLHRGKIQVYNAVADSLDELVKKENK